MLSVKREREEDVSNDINPYPYAWWQAPGPLQPAQLQLAAPDDSDEDVVIPKRAVLPKPRLGSAAIKHQTEPNDSYDDIVITKTCCAPQASIGLGGNQASR
jgi:hypothetical protein